MMVSSCSEQRQRQMRQLLLLVLVAAACVPGTLSAASKLPPLPRSFFRPEPAPGPLLQQDSRQLSNICSPAPDHPTQPLVQSSAGAGVGHFPPDSLSRAESARWSYVMPPDSYTHSSSSGVTFPPPRPPPLLKRINIAGLKMLFALLLWRTLGGLDLVLATPHSSAVLRLPSVMLQGALLSANLFGLLLSFWRPLNFKNQLKFILGLNILQEGGGLLLNVLRVLFPGAGNLREVFLFDGLLNFWWVTLCYTYTRSRWTLETIDERVDLQT